MVHQSLDDAEPAHLPGGIESLAVRVPAMLAVTAVAYAVIGGAIVGRDFLPAGNLFRFLTASRPRPIAASAWRDFAPPNGRFRVSLPGTPSPQLH